ncbi:MAG: HAF repeat-containing protein [Acidobacteria bacterium]|nr:HAF repeat-containing protein [Acidobacteriota bacterium]
MKLLALIAAAAAGVIVSAAPVYTIIDMGTMGGSQTTGAAINQFGQVTGYGVDAQGNLHAFTSGSGAGDITPAWANGGAAGYGINASGQVAGVSYVNGKAVATSWNNGTAQALGGLGGSDSYAMAINSSGQIAGMASTSNGQGHAVIYSNGQVQDVSPAGTSWSSAYGINSSGSVAGYAMNSTGGFNAFVYSAATGSTILTSLGGSSYAFAINNGGQVAGASISSTGYSHAVVWSGSGVTDLGTLGGGASFAYGINDSGSVVGYSMLAGNNSNHAFVYIGGAMFDLNLLVSNLGGWQLTNAYAINESGQIVGTGTLNGVEHAFVLTPQTAPLAAEAALPVHANPEPGTVALFITGLAALFSGRYLRNRLASRVD